MKILKKITKILCYTYLGLLVLSQGLSSCMSFKTSQKDIDKAFAKLAQKPIQHQIEVMDRSINYAEIGSDTLPVAFFIHGSPGSWSAFMGFMKDTVLLKKVKMVSVDRAGFGDSGLGDGEKSLEKQAAYLKPIVAKFKKSNKKIILIGHSLGGPMIARMAMDYPELIDALIFVAPSIAPELEPKEWYRRPGDSVFLRYLLPSSLRASNREILYLKPELERMLPLWASIRQPAIVIQGQKDMLVHPGNAAFAQKMLVNSKRVTLVMLDDQNHFIPWSKPEVIKEAIVSQLLAIGYKR